MICPNKKCGHEIDDDSKHCDQCGSEILVCPKCGNYGTSKFCAADGQRMNSLKSADSLKNLSLPSAVNDPAPPANSAPSKPGATTRLDINISQTAGSIKMKHASGVVIDIKSGTILGRACQVYSDLFSTFKFVSGKHLEIHSESGIFYIKDMNSTNKTRLNGAFLEPEKSYSVKTGDVILLADQEFKII